MYVKLAAAILSIVLPLALRAHSISPSDRNQSGAAVVGGIEAGKREMHREQEMDDRRRQQEFDRRVQLERTELQREMDRQQRKEEQQRRQLLQLQAQSEAQRTARANAH
jgi:hypothetical protein